MIPCFDEFTEREWRMTYWQWDFSWKVVVIPHPDTVQESFSFDKRWLRKHLILGFSVISFTKLIHRQCLQYRKVKTDAAVSSYSSRMIICSPDLICQDIMIHITPGSTPRGLSMMCTAYSVYICLAIQKNIKKTPKCISQ